MGVHLGSATMFMTANARLLDQRRLAYHLGECAPEGVLRALDAYRNDDGGYGSGLEPDLRAANSQPGAALHAFEVFDELAPVRDPCAVELCDWLGSVSLADGGLPFALPVSDPTACAPFWTTADSTVSSLHITAAITALALRVAETDQDVAAHPWLSKATDFCLDRVRTRPLPTHALELKFTMQFLDAVVGIIPEADADLARIRSAIPPDGRLHVGGGLDDEFVNVLDFAPHPATAARRLFNATDVSRELDRLEAEQQRDGGWPCPWTAYSPIASLEWRGWLTVHAVRILRDNARA